MIMELTSKLEILQQEKNEQCTRFENELRTPEDRANELQKKISSVSNENEILKKRVNEFNLQTPKANLKKSTKENVEYEVEALLAHKKKYGRMCYLIRWKNFGPNHDTWERETNLNCSSMLNRYKKENNII